ncbi:hypothetical protein [Flagellimonas eckloniae]|uniref:Uncharacterized protein n=1 Tax=Flagellimonas eckloniae TaxID=346185 RepID=A0A0Q0WZW4_9FLAO|nr:hypothetical protein [Allomuricauda eckloniae]KQC30938.1 hypothetical protein AAY42_14335 [Allomuricauda eckloniae]
MKNWLPVWLRSNTQNKKVPVAQTSKTDSFLLIEGAFTPLQAADILLSLINDKIKFHTVQLLNLKDINQIDFLNSEHRIRELRETKNQITKIILDARTQDKHLTIHSNIEVSTTDKLS